MSLRYTTGIQVPPPPSQRLWLTGLRRLTVTATLVISTFAPSPSSASQPIFFDRLLTPYTRHSIHSMPPKTPSLSVHISYRLDGSKVAYMRSREHDVCEYYPEFLERHLLYLQLPSKWMYDTTLQSLPEGKIQCRWLAGIVDDDSEIAGQVEFLNNPGAAQLLRLLEISKIELAQP
ncbi:uncharacterized protein B0H18DRAFT_1106899 [Fomitopsis serialis]|uniref:uncharacterized protein n=1 Tax=Fomitopsis serialis TaxID=139415 RepID=UPI002007B4EA|nr:uncharacterized protein B0H18DRAFT_1106899 [Neoantrodia serialis]KAH9918611.1 hypothetical protein B0H18DRAFT_1106899 [Neoantrodia serialis]